MTEGAAEEVLLIAAVVVAGVDVLVADSVFVVWLAADPSHAARADNTAHPIRLRNRRETLEVTIAWRLMLNEVSRAAFDAISILAWARPTKFTTHLPKSSVLRVIAAHRLSRVATIPGVA